MREIEYRKGYKYQLAAPFEMEVPIFPLEEISNRFVRLTPKGLLSMRQDYAWDGPSGPTADTQSSILCSLPHDGLYGLIGDGLLDIKYRPIADLILYHLALESNMFPPRAKAWHSFVREFGAPYARRARPIIKITI